MTDTNKSNPMKGMLIFGKHVEECKVCKLRWEKCFGIVVQIGEHAAATITEEM